MGNNAGQTALIVVGTAVGTYFGYPGLGMALGGLVGQVAFPTELPTITGPRLNDTQAQTSSVGAAIPVLWGTYVVHGNLMWSSGIIETMKKKKAGGKGGPTQKIKTYSYKVNCAVGICEGPVGLIRRVWADSKLVYDPGPQRPQESFSDFFAREWNNGLFTQTATFYYGTEDQMPDPTIESFEGIGRVSAFRGLVYVVFNDFQLEQYGNRIPNFRFEVIQPTEGDEAVTVGKIIQDVCLRSDITALDVSQLIDPELHLVDGYVVARAANGRDMIQPLLTHTRFDCVERGTELAWLARTGAPTLVLEEAELAAHTADTERPDLVTITRQQEVELPKAIRIHYAQPLRDYEVGEQTASRISVNTIMVMDVEAPIAMADTKAARCADILLYEAWVGRNRYRVTVGADRLMIEPADVVLLPVDGKQVVARVVTVDHSLPTLLRLELVAEDAFASESYALGSDPAYEDAGSDGFGIARWVVMDLPLASTADSDAGYFVAVAADGASQFGGSTVFRSVDGGATYDEVVSTELPATIGTLDEALPSGPTTIFDEGNEIVVTLYADDELESLTEPSLLAGKNSAAIGADGRWEIVQFRDAELVFSSPQTNTWRLTGLLRGRRGTEWAVGTSLAGDWFVLLDEAVMRLSHPIAQLGAVRSHKAVLVGTSIDDATAEEFTPQGVALKPYAPTALTVTDDAGDLVIEWVRRSRAGTELIAGDVPLWEASESYEVHILDAADLATVVRVLYASTPTATYTAADQALDFGSPVPSLVIRVHQVSATVGRGYALEGTYP